MAFSHLTSSRFEKGDRHDNVEGGNNEHGNNDYANNNSPLLDLKRAIIMTMLRAEITNTGITTAGMGRKAS